MTPQVDADGIANRHEIDAGAVGDLRHRRVPGDDAGDFLAVAFHLLKRGDGDLVGHDLSFRLEHRVERLGRIGQRLGIDGNLALDQPAHGGEIALRVDAERI